MKVLKYIENFLALVTMGLFIYLGIFTTSEMGYYGVIAIMTVATMCAVFWMMWLPDVKLFLYAKTMLFAIFILLSIIGIKSGEGILLINGLLSVLGSLVNYERLRREG